MITRVIAEREEKEIFSMLQPETARWFKRKFKRFTPPQRCAIPEILAGNNILVSSPTGSGKTLAAFLAVIDYLIKLKKSESLEDKIYAIYVSPLRALNNDIKRNLEPPLQGIGRYIEHGIRTAVRTSDTLQSEKQRMLRKPPHILITTPESFTISLNSPRFSKLMSEAKYIIVDEIHALADNKRGALLSLAIERLQARMKHQLIRIGLSATVYPLDEVARFLVGVGRECKIIDVNYLKPFSVEVKTPAEDLIYTPTDVMTASLYKLIDGLVQKHEMTLIFTNTRSGTERVVYHLRSMFPKKYRDNIAAHHSSLSREIRHSVEEKMKRGELKVVVSSTSLELGIDVGDIDLVILLGSPKSTIRALQRIGRSGHRLEEESKGILIALDRDDLMECVAITKNIRVRKFDKIRIPNKPTDVLAQHLVGMALEKVWDVEEAYRVITRSYNFKDLRLEELDEVLRYLGGGYTELEERRVYAKLWYEEGKFGRRGKLTRAIYFMNVGVIPDEADVPVILLPAKKYIGSLEEGFAEHLMPGDVFVLGGKTYEFSHSRGSKVFVHSAEGRKPTIPAWFSEMLPLSYDLAADIEKLRSQIKRMSIAEISKEYGVSNDVSKALKLYVEEQERVAVIPDARTFLVEEYVDESGIYNYIFHTLAGRKANEAFARAFAFLIGKKKKISVRAVFNDYGIMLGLGRWKRLTKREIEDLLTVDDEAFISAVKEALNHSELLRRRFREVAVRSFAVLRRYPGREAKSLGKQQLSADNLLQLVLHFYPDFPPLKETFREILEEAMHVDEALDYLHKIRGRKLYITRERTVPSPFAFNIVATGARDVITMEDRKEFLRRLHMKLMKELRETKK